MEELSCWDWAQVLGLGKSNGCDRKVGEVGPAAGARGRWNLYRLAHNTGLMAKRHRAASLSNQF